MNPGRSIRDRLLGLFPVGDGRDGRIRRVRLRRRIHLWVRFRIPRPVRAATSSLFFLLCEGLFWVLGCRRRSQDVRRILVIKLDHIGDALMATPAIRALRHGYPHAEIIWVVGSWSAPVARVNPHIDRLITYDAVWYRRRTDGVTAWWRRLRTRLQVLGLRADIAVNLRGDCGNVLFTYLTGARQRAALLEDPDVGGGRPHRWLTHPVAYRPGVHWTDRYLEVVTALGAVPDGHHLDFPVSAAARRVATELLAGLPLRSGIPLVVIHPGSSWPFNWWPAERYAALAEWLTESGRAAVLFVGGKEERELVERIRDMLRHPAASLCGQTTFEVLAAILQHAALLVCNDGGVMHLAEALEVPLVVLFGCSSLAEVGPRSRQVRGIQGPAPQPPCPKFEWAVNLACPDHPCMRGITLVEVQAALAELLPEMLPEPRGAPATMTGRYDS